MHKTNGQLKASILQGLALTEAGQVLTLPRSRKTRALLAYLLLSERPVSREHLCNLLWQDTEDPKAALRWSLSKLRPLLAESLITEKISGEVSIAIDSDIAALREAIQAPAPNTQEALSKLQQAASYFGDEYLPGLEVEICSNYQLWLESKRTHLRELHGKLFEKITDCPLLSSNDKLDYLRQWVMAIPLDEMAVARLIHAVKHKNGTREARNLFNKTLSIWQKHNLDTEPLEKIWIKTAAEHNSISLGSVESSLKPQQPVIQQDDQSPFSLPERPSLAVIGFHSSSDQFANLVATGLTVDITSHLSALGGIFVTSRSSATRFLHSELPSREIGQLLGVAYLLSGNIQTEGSKIRITVDLVDATCDKTLWTDSYLSIREDLFTLQETITGAVVSAVEPQIERSEFERARLKQPGSLDAWENYHLALWHAFRFTRSGNDTADHFLSRALEQDPYFCRAHAAMSLVHFSRAFLNETSQPNLEIKLAREYAENSLNLDARDAMAHWSLGRAEFLNAHHDQALTSIQRALEANPNYALGHYMKGFVSAHAGIIDNAIPELDKATRLSPFDPLLFAMKSSRGIALALAGDYEQAAHWAVLATSEANAHFHIHAIAAACLELANRSDEAKEFVTSTKERHPNYCQEVFFRSFPYKYKDERKLIADALTRAGLI